MEKTVIPNSAGGCGCNKNRSTITPGVSCQQLIGWEHRIEHERETLLEKNVQFSGRFAQQFINTVGSQNEILIY